MSSLSEQSGSGNRPWRERRPPVSTEKLFDRLPPHSLEAEMSLLGSILLDPRQLSDVLAIVRKPEEFYSEAHATIFRAVVEVYDRFNSGDLVQIVEAIKDKGQLEQVGGADYLVKLAESVPSAVNAPHYARIVAEKAKLRKLIDAAGTMLYEAYHTGELGPDGAREVLDKAEMAVFEIAQQQELADPQLLKDLLQLEIDRIESQEGKGISGVPTGFLDLDDLLRGMQPGELVIVAARPSMGKTALALNIAEQMAIGVGLMGHAPTPNPVALFSLEMSKSAVTQRLISARSGIPSQNLRGGHKLNDREYRKLLSACDELAKAPVFIDDTPNMTVLALRARARRLVAQHGVKAIMIDYLQLLTAPGAARESRQVEVSTISRNIKALARELNVPVICLSQLNRASEQREGNKPRMSDLRESGSIEQDADVIVLLHREDYYHTQDPDWSLDNPDKVGVAELIVAKQRNGPTGVVRLTWDSSTTRFKNYAGANVQPPPEFAGGAAPFGGAIAGGGGSGGGGGGGGYDTAAGAASSFVEPAPRSAFAPARKTGPIDNHRDGGGPDRGDEAMADDGHDSVGGVPF
ncbi:MAG: replicative DNA helicase [Planctomycetes bacterium]|nr:replicative DNA helicase [Planctomycetota bacterium]